MRYIAMRVARREFQSICQQARQKMGIGDIAHMIAPLSGHLGEVNNQISLLLNRRLRCVSRTGQLCEERRDLFYQWSVEVGFKYIQNSGQLCVVA